MRQKLIDEAHVRDRDRLVITTRLRVRSPVTAVQRDNALPQQNDGIVGAESVDVPGSDAKMSAMGPLFLGKGLRKELRR